jgi:SAM-dependent methyltransferase
VHLLRNPRPASGDTFYQRAGVEPRDHADYLAALRKLILHRFGKPAFIVGAKRDAAALADEPVRPVSLNGRPAWLAISGGGRTPQCRTTDELLAQLARSYRSVYDFGCGYGAALRPFSYFIGSDIDRKCLAYVQRELLS